MFSYKINIWIGMNRVIKKHAFLVDDRISQS